MNWLTGYAVLDCIETWAVAPLSVVALWGHPSIPGRVRCVAVQSE